ncbi:tetratricopeptide repeat protein [Paraglaciecola sp.]|uniref:tetratricopeptide repeat protein n=1 Tax=Paraglaciecola sp. TaxID=1920173 RepID=UPI0030F3F945
MYGQQGQQRSLLIILILLVLLIALGASATPYTPNTQEQIVAKWDISSTDKDQSLSLQQRLEKAAWHIQQGQYAGQANKHYGRARALLSPLFNTDATDTWENKAATTHSHALYLWARVLQHQHQFSQAQQVLEQAIILDNGNSAALLLKANVLLAQGQFTKSKQACTQLLGKADLVLTSACVLEVSANQEQLVSSYAQLSRLLTLTHTIPNKPATDQQQDWLLQLAADMALRLDLKSEAQTWLASGLTPQQSLAQKPLSFIVLWADIELSLKQEQKVLSQLSIIVNQAGFKDDALLTRLSMAEKSTTKAYWQTLLAERINLRIARKDTFHSADLARYFLDIKPDPELALYWAQINWQQAKLNDDKQLLNRALMMQNTGVTRADS